MSENIEFGVEDVDSFSTEARSNMRSRARRKDILHQMICKHGNTTTKDHLLGVFMQRNYIGLSATSAYLLELKMGRFVVEYGDKLLSIEQYNAIQEEDTDRLKELAGSDDE